MRVILTLNAGSSSVKFAIFEATEDLPRLSTGQVENIGANARLVMKHPSHTTAELGNLETLGALEVILDALAPTLAQRELVSIGHRVVHGGTEFDAPCTLTDEIVSRLHKLDPLAPLHQPHNLKMVESAMARFAGVQQVGCFDTAFHRTQPWVNETFALPNEFFAAGVRRYGFHGLSYQYIAQELAARFPKLHAGKVIAAHLGNGSSLCAMQAGQSIATTMGFSALDGLPMGTRCGQIDPGVLLYLLEQGMGREDLAELLYKKSGLLGLSGGLSYDMRTLLGSDAEEARDAVRYYCARIRREIGALAATLGGVDALIFTGGIGENAQAIRAKVMQGLDFLGLSDTDAAGDRTTKGGTDGTLRTVMAIPTDEEQMIARACLSKVAPR